MLHEDGSVVGPDGGVVGGDDAAASGTQTLVGIVAEGDEDAVVEIDGAVEGAAAGGQIVGDKGPAVDRHLVADKFEGVAVTVARDGVGRVADGERRIGAVGEVVVDSVDPLGVERLVVGVALDGDGIEHGVGAGEGDRVGRIEPVEGVDGIVGGAARIVDEEAEMLGVDHGALHVLDGFGAGDIDARLCGERQHREEEQEAEEEFHELKTYND